MIPMHMGSSGQQVKTEIRSHEYFFEVIFILGPDLPKPLQRLQMVKFDDTVIAIGRYYSRSLYKFVCSEECHWEEMLQKEIILLP